MNRKTYNSSEHKLNSYKHLNSQINSVALLKKIWQPSRKTPLFPKKNKEKFDNNFNYKNNNY